MYYTSNIQFNDIYSHQNASCDTVTVFLQFFTIKSPPPKGKKNLKMCDYFCLPIVCILPSTFK